MSWSRRLWIAPLVAVLPAVTSMAEDLPRVRVGIQVEREVAHYNSAGELVLEREAVDHVEVGDVLVYSLQIVNDGPVAAVRAQVVDPIPENTVLILDSAAGDGTRITYSVDGGSSYAPYPVTQVVSRDGVEEEVPVPAEDYTHVRWTLMQPLEPGEMRTGHFKVRVQAPASGPRGS